MIFRNGKTGNVIDVPCEITGPDWERIDGDKTPAAKKKPAGRKTAKEPEGK